MGLFSNQFSNVVEWNESRDDVIFWLWRNKEIKRGSRLIIRPGQDAIFLYNGKIEGIFKDEGNYEIESEIIPFLTTLKGFKFGFNTPLRAEVLFVNTKEFLIRWGTKNAINIPTASLKGGLPIRSFGTFSVKIHDYLSLIDRVAGVKQQFTVDDVKERVLAQLDQLLMRWISKEGKDMFNLQANSYEIANGINCLKYEKNVYPRSYFEKTVPAEFEGHFFPIPEQYDALLRVLYGDYMIIPPEEDRKCKEHSVLVDLNRSYEEYAHYRDGMKFEIHTRSIR